MVISSILCELPSFVESRALYWGHWWRRVGMCECWGERMQWPPGVSESVTPMLVALVSKKGFPHYCNLSFIDLLPFLPNTRFDIHLVSSPSAFCSPVSHHFHKILHLCLSAFSKVYLLTIWIGHLRTHRTKNYKGIWISPSPFSHFNCIETDFQTKLLMPETKLGLEAKFWFFSLHNIIACMIDLKRISVYYLFGPNILIILSHYHVIFFNNKMKTKLVIKR